MLETEGRFALSLEQDSHRTAFIFAGIVGALGVALAAHLLQPDRRPDQAAGAASRVSPQAIAPSADSQACRDSYARLYDGDGLEIRMVFGYKDARPARFVGDRYERLVFLQWMLEPCKDDQYACGFKRSATDAELFTKTVKIPDGAEKTVRLRIIASAVGPDDEENRRDPFQAWQSARAGESFHEGLRSADVVFYNGHSRAGGGPDFKPPRLSGDKHADYTWYQSQTPGLKELIGTLSASESRVAAQAKVLGLFSCISNGHFAGKILETKEDLGLIASSKLLYFSDALENSRIALSALIGMKCQPDFDRALKGQASSQAGTRMIGFF